MTKLNTYIYIFYLRKRKHIYKRKTSSSFLCSFSLPSRGHGTCRCRSRLGPSFSSSLFDILWNLLYPAQTLFALSRIKYRRNFFYCILRYLLLFPYLFECIRTSKTATKASEWKRPGCNVENRCYGGANRFSCKHCPKSWGDPLPCCLPGYLHLGEEYL